ncbi:MAG: prepilin-type N-terminal cleavage/methylation domain-containing protein [Planctomycetes bacterium]|nr:prepilin-type N-terminal cleavage/methylation domain-containing protein [Planctomycetota bacterium]
MRATAPGGFSLIELMLAMTILGLGLVMVATMFPVAWTRARTMAEFTTQENVTKSAEVILQQIARVDDGDDTNTLTGSFAGTILYYPLAGVEQVLFKIERQQRVHALYMENMTVDAPRRMIPDRLTPDASNNFAPWRLELKNDPMELTLINDALLPMTGFYQSTFGTAQISLEQRVYPPLPRRDFATIDLAGLITGVDADWEEELDRRRYAWAILHRFRHEPTDPGSFTPAKYQALAAEPRDLDIYYVTLRRSRPTNRYAVQDPTATMVPFPIAQPAGSPPPARGLLQVNPPAALPPADDLVLPVPWRIQVRFPGTLAGANECDVSLEACNDNNPCPMGETCVLGAGATGVPTEIEVNWDAGVSAPFVMEMFTRGTPFIDEASGKIYRVARRRLAGKNDEKAILTLDREVLIEDIDDGFWDDTPGSIANQHGDLFLINEELIRSVWVFPPPVERDRDGNGEPIFSGKQPVVGINVRTLTVHP